MKKITLILSLFLLSSCIAEKTTVGKLCTRIKTNPNLITDYEKGKMFKMPLFFFDLTFLPNGDQEWIGKDPTGKTYARVTMKSKEGQKIGQDCISSYQAKCTFYIKGYFSAYLSEKNGYGNNCEIRIERAKVLNKIKK
tara:strand:+ start:2588 stop:3001 length:414 start_codon:yes stop_codon:yes gene_type:complete